eukprot:5294751-Prymnesium_polylepis.1
MPPDDEFSAYWPVSVMAFSRMSVVTRAPKQAAKASPNASMFVSLTAPSPRTVTRMSSSFAWCATLTAPGPSPTPRAAPSRGTTRRRGRR